MRTASNESPFSASTREERQARWLQWQQQSVEVASEGAETQGSGRSTYVQEPPVPAIQHRRYDAVVQRMQNAKRQTGAYSTWA